jgi:tetratricopeptide (TPR) repeat protein
LNRLQKVSLGLALSLYSSALGHRERAILPESIFGKHGALASGYEIQGNNVKAMAEYGLAIKEYPKQYLLRFMRCKLELKLKDYAGVISDVDAFLPVATENYIRVEGYGARAQSYEALGKIEQAAKDYESAVKQARPNEEDQHLDAAKFYVRIKKRDLAMRHYKAAYDMYSDLKFREQANIAKEELQKLQATH